MFSRNQESKRRAQAAEGAGQGLVLTWAVYVALTDGFTQDGSQIVKTRN